MLSYSLDIVAKSRPGEFTGLATLLNTVVDDERYRDLLSSSLNSNETFTSHRTLVEIGYFNGVLFLSLLNACGAKDGISIQLATKILDRLIDWALITDSSSLFSDVLLRYSWNKPRIKAFSALNIIENIIFGAPYIVDRYKKSVIPIHVKKGPDDFTGTGFLVPYQSSPARFAIATAKHNIDKKDGVTDWKLGSTEGASFKPLAPNWLLHPRSDLALLPVECSENVPPLFPFGEERVLTRIITLGYPRIATASANYLLAHAGEINAAIENFFGEKMLIVSNIVSSGNSGGPVLDESGLCVGMIISSLESRHEGGVSTANAALPAHIIHQFTSNQTDG